MSREPKDCLARLLDDIFVQELINTSDQQIQKHFSVEECQGVQNQIENALSNIELKTEDKMSIESNIVKFNEQTPNNGRSADKSSHTVVASDNVKGNPLSVGPGREVASECSRSAKSRDIFDDVSLIPRTIPGLINHLWDLYESMSIDPALSTGAEHIRQAAMELEEARQVAFEVFQEERRKTSSTHKGETKMRATIDYLQIPTRKH